MQELSERQEELDALAARRQAEVWATKEEVSRSCMYAIYMWVNIHIYTCIFI